MKNRILVISDGSGGTCGKTLLDILESASSLGAQIEKIGLDAVGSRVKDLDIAFKPNLIFAIAADHSLQRAIKLLRYVKESQRETPVIVLTEADDPDDAFALLKLGAADFITPPLRSIDILPRVRRLLEHSSSTDTVTNNLKEKHGLKRMVGESSAFLAEIKRIPLIARCDATVLISGETGTGKELSARAIHYLSSRAGKPFVPVNCGAIPIDLAENELFGHERGAFTGAWGRHPGLIGEADGGTLFLDELDCLPLLAQVKLLRFLQEKEYRALGSSRSYKADVRIITSANMEFEEAMKTGKLRPDLYYRLNVLTLRLPPLRERREDIPLLARYFLAMYAAEFGKPPLVLSEKLMQTLMAYDWPGNVRELQHTIERAVAICETPVIQDADVQLPRPAAMPGHESFQQAKSRVIAQFERSYIESLLLAFRGNITRAARASHKNRRAFWELIRKHRIDVQSFKTMADNLDRGRL